MTEAIRSYSLETRRWQMRNPVRTAKSEWSARTSIVLALEAGHLTGYGEASPLPGYSTSSLEECERELSRVAPQLIGSSLLTPWETTLDRFDELGLSPCSHFALETAVVDLHAKALGVPLWQLLRGATAGAPEPIPLSSLLHGDSAASSAASAREALGRGIRSGKLKVGYRDAELERSLVRGIRDALGDDFAIRLDANGAWPEGDVRDRLLSFAEFSPDYIEEPSDVRTWLALDTSPVPLAIDESLARPDGTATFEALAARHTCQVVIVKLGTVGGISGARALARVADAAGVDVVVTHMLDGPIATAAAAAFALSLPRHRRCAGLDVRAYASWPKPDAGWFGENAVLPWQEPGLGLVAYEQW